MKEHTPLILSSVGLFILLGYTLRDSSSWLTPFTSAVMGAVVLWLALEAVYWQGRKDALRDARRMQGRDLS